MPVLATTRIDRYYRTTIPREIRKSLGLNMGNEMKWIFEDGENNNQASMLKGENS